MKINWKVRIKNPVFWWQIVAVVMGPMLAAAGMSWEQITSWPLFRDLVLISVQNPVVLTAMVAGIWSAINDPTTTGLGDSAQALTYTAPKCDG